jgi:copper chaperone CopZ
MKFRLLYAIVLMLCTTFASNTQAQTTDTTITVKVKGITCSSDLKMIKTSVEKLEGISECKIGKQGATSKITIKFNPQLSTKEAIYKAIEGTGGCKKPEERPYKVKQ